MSGIGLPAKAVIATNGKRGDRYLLLGQDRGLGRRRPAFDHSDDTDHTLTPRPDGGRRLPPRRSKSWDHQAQRTGHSASLLQRPGLIESHRADTASPVETKIL